MCGFLGQINQVPLTESDFKALLALSRHRGPDQCGYWLEEQVQLGFNRLAILDLTVAGNQPMQSPHQNFVIVFNGEIYNHQELRKALPQYNYRGTSDTETITHALEVWGVEATIKKLDGMFAMAIYDRRQKALYLVRDFAGIKPLFFAQRGRAIVFASQYDQIIHHPDFKNASIRNEVLKLYLEQHFIPAPFGLHEGTAQVRPGEIIRFDSEGNRTILRYWELSDSGVGDIKNSEEAQKHISDALAECVQDELVADVPLGAFLSGGVDSPLICAHAFKYKKDLQVFSIGSDSKVHDESERSKLFAKAMHVRQDLWQLDARQMMQYWEEAMKSLHEPFADFSLLPTYLVSKRARKQVTVALSGDGGDELFLGYERFWSIGKNIKYQHWPLVARKALYGFDKYATGNKRLNSVLLMPSQASAHQNLHSRFHKTWLERIAPDLTAVKLPEEFDTYKYANTGSERELIGRMRKAEFYGMMQKTLRKVDLASMQNSLEVRVPFLQKKFIVASLQIDPMLSYGGGKKKQVLKNLLVKEFPEMPDDNIKRGFSIPLAQWIKEDLRSVFEEKLLSGKYTQFGFDTGAMEAMLRSHSNGEKDFKWPLFTLYTLAGF
ncbi:MAG: asparagine synthase (glutamine-hydrolyzing) [Bacteroidetes bacterium]|nr:asparagine synthase (glutamine-hydrolyzing) [Bacteroidota bacterium]